MGITTIIAATINLVIDLLLVKKIGLFAASSSTLVSYLFLFVYRMFDVRKFQRIEYNYGRIILFVLVLVIMCVFCWMNRFALNILNAVFGITFAIVSNRKNAKEMLAIVKNKVLRKV